MAKQTINPGTPPIIWSTVEEAFQAINNNFTELYLTVSGGPGTVVDLTDLGTSLIPRNTEIYDLGSSTKRWKDLYLSGSSLHIGSAVITATGSALNLPAGSTIGGNILDQEYFREIAVAGQTNIVADAGGSDILTVAAGNNGITITTDATTDTLSISNSGVLNITTSNGLSTNTLATGAVSITNTGVISFGNGTSLPDARPAGSGISVSSISGSGIDITNTGVLAITTFGGSGITINNPSPGTFEIVNAAPNINQNVFRDITVSGQSTLVADGAQDTLTFVNGTGINITTAELTDSITIENTGVTALAASGSGISVSASSGSVNISNTGVTSLIAGSGISISAGTGDITVTNTRNGFQNFAVSGNPSPIQADATSDTFTFVPGEGVVLIPNPTNDSLEINVSYLVGNVYGEDSSVLINSTLGKIVGPIDSSDGVNSISMTVSGVVIGGTAGASIIGAAGAPIYLAGGAGGGTSGDIYIGNGLNKTLFVSNIIDTDDSSALIFEPPVTFNTNISVEGDISVLGMINGYIRTSTLKSIVADSVDFADFKTRIAALV